jgi:hypothetical protein
MRPRPISDCLTLDGGKQKTGTLHRGRIALRGLSIAPSSVQEKGISTNTYCLQRLARLCLRRRPRRVPQGCNGQSFAEGQRLRAGDRHARTKKHGRIEVANDDPNTKFSRVRLGLRHNPCRRRANRGISLTHRPSDTMQWETHLSAAV